MHIRPEQLGFRSENHRRQFETMNVHRAGPGCPGCCCPVHPLLEAAWRPSPACPVGTLRADLLLFYLKAEVSVTASSGSTFERWFPGLHLPQYQSPISLPFYYFLNCHSEHKLNWLHLVCLCCMTFVFRKLCNEETRAYGSIIFLTKF